MAAEQVEFNANIATALGLIEEPKVFSFPTLADVQEREVEWLVSGYLVRGAINLICAPGGTGKTSILCAIGAAVSSGKPCFFETDSQRRDPIKVLALMAEDDVSTVLKRRFMTNGATEQNILFVPPEHPIFSKCKMGFAEFEQIIMDSQAELVILDPLQQFLSDGVNMSHRNAMRSALTVLLALGQKIGCTFLVAVHTNKGGSTDPRRAIADSADIWDIARSVLMLGQTQEQGILFLSHEKCNSAERAKTILCHFDEGRVIFDGFTNQRYSEYMSRHNSYQAPKSEQAEAMIERSLER